MSESTYKSYQGTAERGYSDGYSVYVTDAGVKDQIQQNGDKLAARFGRNIRIVFGFGIERDFSAIARVLNSTINAGGERDLFNESEEGIKFLTGGKFVRDSVKKLWDRYRNYWHACSITVDHPFHILDADTGELIAIGFSPYFGALNEEVREEFCELTRDVMDTASPEIMQRYEVHALSDMDTLYYPMRTSTFLFTKRGMRI